ncbi:MAG: hypothetical protein IPJ40_11710 [Saprospirales bacterium]|nr:hypothetical protein [Saprospirales bacterium]
MLLFIEYRFYEFAGLWHGDQFYRDHHQYECGRRYGVRFTGATSLMAPYGHCEQLYIGCLQHATGFVPATPQNYVVGQVCFANGSPGIFPAQMTISNGPNDNYWVDSFQDDLTTTCTMQPPCTCKPVVNLTADMSDPCCYFIDVNFPNPAGCTFPTDFNQITVMTTGTGIITGTVGSSPFSATTTSTLATFSTSPGITPLPQLVGQICFANYTPAPFQVQLVVSNSALSPDPCAESFSFPVTTPCPAPCEDIFVADQTVCSTDESLLIPLIGCSNVASCLQQVKWYVRSPCSGPWTLYQVKPDCSDLVLAPNKFTNDICVYAEVLTDGTCNCPLLVSNEATIYLCDPVSCSIQNTNPDFCTCGNPTPIIVVPSISNPNCPYTVVWYDEQGNVVGNSPAYTPTTLCFQGLPTDCYQDFLYKAVIDSPCGKDSCFTTIRVYNDNAPKGSLVLLPAVPPEVQPYCPGEDAILQFTPGCAGDPKMWDWYVRPCVGGSPTYLGNAGKMNPLYLTNKLYQSVYYYVETQNGTCPLDTVQLKIEVKEPPSIISFNAVPDPCVEQQVLLSLDFAPCTIEGCGTNCNCTYSVDWYKDGFVVGTSTGVPR